MRVVMSRRLRPVCQFKYVHIAESDLAFPRVGIAIDMSVDGYPKSCTAKIILDKALGYVFNNSDTCGLNLPTTLGSTPCESSMHSIVTRRKSRTKLSVRMVSSIPEIFSRCATKCFAGTVLMARLSQRWHARLGLAGRRSTSRMPIFEPRASQGFCRADAARGVPISAPRRSWISWSSGGRRRTAKRPSSKPSAVALG